MSILLRNLQALAAIRPHLAERLCWPVDAAHVPMANGHAGYRYRRAMYPLDVDLDVLERTLASIHGRAGILIFGVGHGEQLGVLLEKYPSADIMAWDRDPWLLRSLLVEKDYTSAISSGRLTLALGVDLLDLLDTVAGRQVVAHPLLSGVYADEWRLLTEGPGRKRALVCEGELFVDDLCQALQEEGYGIFRLDTQILSLEEMGETAGRFKPQFVAAVNYREGLAEFCRQHDCPLLCWEIDPTIQHLRPCRVSVEKLHFFVYCQTSLAGFRQAGFEHVTYLPLAANPARRQPASLALAGLGKYQAELSFVGSSMRAQKRKYLDRFLEDYCRFRKGSPEAEREGREVVEEILSEQSKDFGRFVIPQLVTERLKEFQLARESAGSRDNLIIMLGEMAASDKRLAYLSALGPLAIQVWGDEGWLEATAAGVVYRGPAGHFTDLNNIYSASRINLDIGRLYQNDMVTMRVFDILACGGFVLTETNPALADLFRLGEEIETYTSLGELQDKVQFYLAHPNLAAGIARKGREAVLQRHTIAHRVRRMLESLQPAEAMEKSVY